VDSERQLVHYAQDLARAYSASEQAQEEGIDALLYLLELRYPESRGHGPRVAYWLARLNEALDSPLPAKAVRQAGRLHDVGLLASATPDVRVAAPIGAAFLRRIEIFRAFAPWVEFHQHPYSPDLPLGARMLAVADAFDFNVGLLGRHVAGGRRALAEQAGSRLDPDLVAAFLGLPLEELFEALMLEQA